MITTKNGLYMPALSMAKQFSKTGNQISGPEAKTLVTMMKNALVNEYEGTTSSSGLAADRNVVARTTKAIVKNAKQGKWGINKQGLAALTKAFGPKLDGKAGEVGALVAQIRNDVKQNSTGYTYYG